MPLIAETPTGKNFEVVSEGQHLAVLNTIKDLGMIDTVFNGIAKKTRKVQFIWQTDEFDAEKKPKLIFERLTNFIVQAQQAAEAQAQAPDADQEPTEPATPTQGE